MVGKKSIEMQLRSAKKAHMIHPKIKYPGLLLFPILVTSEIYGLNPSLIMSINAHSSNLKSIKSNKTLNLLN